MGILYKKYHLRLLMKLPKKFKLPFSIGTPWVESFLQKRAAKLPSSEFLLISKKLHKNILKVNEEIASHDLPSNLQLAYVHRNVKTGVFLKPNAKPIKPGAFIGIYTGLYELVKGDLCYNTSYAYDVAQEVRLKKEQLSHVVIPSGEKEVLTTKEDYSIQTNAITMGNFTRFINHSSLKPNIEAIVCKLPEGRIEILLFALKKIHPKEQLLSCYGGMYWKALGVIPDDMEPTTYKLDKSGKASPHTKTPVLSLKIKKALANLRNPLPVIFEDKTNARKVKKWKESLPLLKAKTKKEIEDFEEIILERGIPRRFTLSLGKTGFRLLLQKDAKKIRKKEFIGVLAGTIAPGEKLFIKNGEENFLNRIRKSAKANAEITLFYDEDADAVYPILFALEEILPGQEITLKNLAF